MGEFPDLQQAWLGLGRSWPAQQYFSVLISAVFLRAHFQIWHRAGGSVQISFYMLLNIFARKADALFSVNLIHCGTCAPFLILRSCGVGCLSACASMLLSPPPR